MFLLIRKFTIASERDRIRVKSAEQTLCICIHLFFELFVFFFPRLIRTKPHALHHWNAWTSWQVGRLSVGKTRTYVLLLTDGRPNFEAFFSQPGRRLMNDEFLGPWLGLAPILRPELQVLLRSLALARKGVGVKFRKKINKYSSYFNVWTFFPGCRRRRTAQIMAQIWITRALCWTQGRKRGQFQPLCIVQWRLLDFLDLPL